MILTGHSNGQIQIKYFTSLVVINSYGWFAQNIV